jgi:protein required for attachment to host cells
MTVGKPATDPTPFGHITLFKRSMTMEKTWILIANAHRARVLEQHGSHKLLTELDGFVYPKARATPKGDISGDASKGHGRTAHHGTQFEPHTEPQDKERLEFARELACYLNEAANSQTFSELNLIATSPMLGTLRPLLNHAASAMLKRAVPTDLTIYQDRDLKERVELALASSEGQVH